MAERGPASARAQRARRPLDEVCEAGEGTRDDEVVAAIDDRLDARMEVDDG